MPFSRTQDNVLFSFKKVIAKHLSKRQGTVEMPKINSSINFQQIYIFHINEETVISNGKKRKETIYLCASRLHDHQASLCHTSAPQSIAISTKRIQKSHLYFFTVFM